MRGIRNGNTRSGIKEISGKVILIDGENPAIVSSVLNIWGKCMPLWDANIRTVVFVHSWKQVNRFSGLVFVALLGVPEMYRQW